MKRAFLTLVLVVPLTLAAAPAPTSSPSPSPASAQRIRMGDIDKPRNAWQRFVLRAEKVIAFVFFGGVFTR